MTNEELIKHLRQLGKYSEFNPNYFLLSADRIEELSGRVEVKHGKWQEERWCDNFQHICSICHKTVRVHPQSVAYKYCPYCGARMDKESEVDTE